MKNLIILLLAVLICGAFALSPPDEKKETVKIHNMLDNWHKAAAEANFANYFNVMIPNSTFIGTDATERWNKKQFMEYAKPYFDKGKAWNFKRLDRHIYFSHDLTVAWFDEILDTQMKICRGSGVVLRQNGEWKIAHYVLSMTVPNEHSEEIVKIKAPIEDGVMEKIKNLK